MSYLPTQKAFTFFDEFKKFLFKGNMIDMAVAVIIGKAFGDLVAALVAKIIMPLVGGLTATTGAAQVGPDGKPMPMGDIFKIYSTEVGGVPIPYGEFIAEFVNFLILGLVIFIVIVKFVGWITSVKKEEVVAPPPPPPDIALLTEIRDLLKAQQASGGRQSPEGT